MLPNRPFLLLLAAALAPAVALGETARDVIPLTVANLRGHQILYDEGYFVISSSKNALHYAKEHSIESSGAAIRRALADAAARTEKVPGEIESDASASAKTGRRVFESGSKRTTRIHRATASAISEETHFAEENFQRAVDSFVRGNISIARRTQEDRAELAALPGGYYNNLRDDFSDINELTDSARKTFSQRLGPVWRGAFTRARDEFQAGYEASGREHNSLEALGPLLAGWARAIAHGFVAPAAQSGIEGGAAAGEIAVVTPLAGTISVVGRTIQSFGLTVFYAGKIGVHVVSPTLEGGLFAGMSLLSASAVPATAAGGYTVGAINQVACLIASPSAAAGEAAGSMGADAAEYAGTIVYDALSGTAKVVINQSQSGVALGYNALTAIPSHTAMGVADTAIFLAWDGPRLAIAAASGKLRSGDKEYSVGDLPVGSVVDLKKLGQEPGVQVKTISEDPAVIEKVLEKLPDDLREKKP